MDGDDCGSWRDGGARVGVVASTVTFVTLTVAFGALALGAEHFWVAFPVGFGAVMPVAVALARSREPDSEGRSGARTGDDRTDGDPALSTLRERYARGEIDGAAFEDRVETLVATEDR